MGAGGYFIGFARVLRAADLIHSTTQPQHIMQCKEPAANSPMAVDLRQLGDTVRASYREVASQYRTDDEIEIQSDEHRRFSEILSGLTASFGRPITVLEAGCGTGRYFHCLRSVDRLVGVDVSEEMLQIAKNPVRSDRISISSIELRCENIYFAKFPLESFDMIYSLGMFGNGCPVTVEVCNHFYDSLKPGGKLFFNAIGIGTLSLKRRLRQSVRKMIYPWLPASLKSKIDARRSGVPFFGMTKKELEKIMQASRFSDFSVSVHERETQLWRGVHLECMASKPS